MDGIVVLGHFCETHGPCTILCTQKTKEEPQQLVCNKTADWCNACQSIDSQQAFVSRDQGTCYVTSRTPLQPELAFFLKQATVRSLSCEETNKDGGILYFGDEERGHVLSHVFTVHDSLARGFHRKYSILILMRDKVHLLNGWPGLLTYMKDVISVLQKKATLVNEIEQQQRLQRALRQVHTDSSRNVRSLPQLTGLPAVFGHLHSWFCCMLGYKVAIEKPTVALSLFPTRSPLYLRLLSHQMSSTVFSTACYCTLTGVEVICDSEVRDAFRILLPEDWEIPKNQNVTCKMSKNSENIWQVDWPGNLPQKLPTLQSSAEKAMKSYNFQISVLEEYLNSLVVRWLHIAQTLNWCQIKDEKLLQAFNVQNHDLPLLAYWSSQCPSPEHKEQ